VNQQIMDSLNRSGELYLTHTRIRGLLTLRVAIGAPTTGRRHVERAWEAIRGAGEAS
jgi:aromatic-L-amino-acid decarboxylase